MDFYNSLVEFIDSKWGYIVEHYNDEHELFLPVIVGWFLLFSSYWLSGLILFALETKFAPKNIQAIKFQSVRPAQVDESNYNPSFYQLCKVALFNWVFVIFPGLFLLQIATKSIGLGIRVDRELPPLWKVIFHAIIAAPAIDITFYHSHYILHQPWFYKHVHKVHHEFKAPYGLASIYAHWFEVLIGNTVAIMGLGFVLDFHCVEWWVGGILGWIETNTAHSGLELPWAKHHMRNLLNPFGGKGYSDFHDYHHQFFKGNYGHGVFVDRLYGTDSAWRDLCKTKSDKLSFKGKH